MSNNNNIGVLTEQGFVAGNGLGFNPIKENELQNDPSKEKSTDGDKKKN